MQFQREDFCCVFGFLEIEDLDRVAGIPKNRDLRNLGLNFLEQLEPFPAQVWACVDKPGHISTRMSQARGIAGDDEIAGDTDNDRNVVIGVLQGAGGGFSMGQHKRDFGMDQFRRESGKPIEFAVGVMVFDDDVLALFVTELAQAETKSLEPGAERLSRDGAEKADARDIGLLRLRYSHPKSECRNESENPSPFWILGCRSPGKAQDGFSMVG